MAKHWALICPDHDEPGLWNERSGKLGGLPSRVDPKRLGVVDEAMMDGVEGEFEAVRNAQLVEDVVQMIFNRLFTDEKLFADLFIAITLGHELHDLLLAVAQQRLIAPGAVVGTLGEGLHDLGGHAVIEPDFAAIDAVNALDQEIAGGLLQDDSARAQAHGADDVAIVFGGGEHDDAGRQRIEIDFLEHGQAVFIRHAQIEQQNIGLEFAQHADAFVAVGSFADDGDIFFAVEKLAEAVTENNVVVGHQDANGLFGFSHVSRGEPLPLIERHGLA